MWSTYTNRYTIGFDVRGGNITANAIKSGPNQIDCSIEEQGDGYIRYSSGLQICWKHIVLQNLVQNNDFQYICNFPKAFNNAPSVTVNFSSMGSPGTFIGAEYINSVECQIWLRNTMFNLDSFWINYTAIGTWK